MLRILCMCVWLSLAMAGCADTWVQCEKHLVPINPVPASGGARHVLPSDESRRAQS